MRLAAPLAVSIALVAAGCGGGSGSTPDGLPPAPPVSSASAARGKQVFDTAGCAGCHTLSAAGATGRVGPDLDGAGVTYAQAFRQVAGGGGGMPAFRGRLSNRQIADVAAFVAQASS